jgi:hypothetical protein
MTKEEMEELKRSRNEFLMRGDDLPSASQASTLATSLAGMTYEQQVEHLIGNLKKNNILEEPSVQISKSESNLNNDNNLNEEQETSYGVDESPAKETARKTVTIAEPEGMIITSHLGLDKKITILSAKRVLRSTRFKQDNKGNAS